MNDDPHLLGDALCYTEHHPGETPTGDWQPLATRIGDAALRDRVERIQDAFSARSGTPVDRRVAASVEHLGLAARLISAHICGRAVGAPADLDAAEIWCREVPGRLLQISVVCREQPSDPLEHSAIRDLTDRVHRLYAVSPLVLWGNIGSAANSTLNLLRTGRPDLLAAATDAADEILHDERVDGGGLHAGPDFRRRSCCLIYRAGIGTCGDCVLQR